MMPPPPMGGPPPGMPPGTPPGMPPGMPMPPPPPPQQQGQGTPGLDILKLLMQMKQRGAGPMSGGVGSVPPLSQNMPYSLSQSGEGQGIYDMIAKLIGQTGKA